MVLHIYCDLCIVDVNVCSVLLLYVFVVVHYFCFVLSFFNILLFSFDIRGE